MKRLISLFLILLLTGCTAPGFSETTGGFVGWPEGYREKVAEGGGTARPDYTPGMIDGRSYENGFFGFGFTLPEGWEWGENEKFEAYAVKSGGSSLSFRAGAGSASGVYGYALERTPPALEEAGFTDVEVEEISVTLAGEPTAALKITSKIGRTGTELHILTVFIDLNGWYGEFNITTAGEDNTQEILDILN
ncbi:MAG: hypothetical protein IJP43_01355 [Oscillospiraceae bacterium]|nr:hypothetical protein [Oscillospiraceae bacterium]